MEMGALGTAAEEIENARLVGRKRDRESSCTRRATMPFESEYSTASSALVGRGRFRRRQRAENHPSAVARIGARSVKTCGSGQRPGVRRASLVVLRGSGPPWRYRPYILPIGSVRAGALDACSIGVSPSRKELYDKLIGVCLGFASCRKTEHRRVAEPLGFKNVPSISARTICILSDPDAVGLDFSHDRNMRHSPSCFHNKKDLSHFKLAHYPSRSSLAGPRLRSEVRRPSTICLGPKPFSSRMRMIVHRGTPFPRLPSVHPCHCGGRGSNAGAASSQRASSASHLVCGGLRSSASAARRRAASIFSSGNALGKANPVGRSHRLPLPASHDRGCGSCWRP